MSSLSLKDTNCLEWFYELRGPTAIQRKTVPYMFMSMKKKNVLNHTHQRKENHELPLLNMSYLKQAFNSQGCVNVYIHVHIYRKGCILEVSALRKASEISSGSRVHNKSFQLLSRKQRKINILHKKGL